MMIRGVSFLGMIFAIFMLAAFVFLWAGLSLAGTPQPNPPNKDMKIDKLSPQPEPPDKHLKLKSLGPQPEPPDSPLQNKTINKGVKTKSSK